MMFATAAELITFVDDDGMTLERATLLVEMASSAAENAARQINAAISQHTETVTLDGDGTSRLVQGLLWPITAVSTVTIIGTDGTETQLRGPNDPEPEYQWSRIGVLTRVGACWPDRPRSIVVTYTYGFAPEDVPSEIKNVTLRVAARLSQSPAGEVQGTMDGAQFGFAQADQLIPSDALTVLRALR